MISLNVPDMSCGHCKATVEEAIISLDTSAKVAVDLDTRHVVVITEVNASEVIKALNAAGYPATESK